MRVRGLGLLNDLVIEAGRQIALGLKDAEQLPEREEMLHMTEEVGCFISKQPASPPVKLLIVISILSTMLDKIQQWSDEVNRNVN